MALSYLISGVDLLSLECITKADVQQAITNAQPRTVTPDYATGFVIVSDAAPDVVTNPALANFIWLRSLSLVPVGEFYYYNGTTWVLLSVIDGNQIAPGSIPLSKLSLLGALPYYIIQVNAAGDALNFVSIPNAIQNGTIPVNKLVPGGAGDFGLVSLSGVNQYITLASLVNYFTANTIAIDKLIKGPASTHGLFLRTFEDGTLIEWADFDPNEQIDNGELLFGKLSGVGFSALQVVRRNAANTAWEGASQASIQPTPVYGTSTVVAAIVDVSITKPTGKTWLDFELLYTGSFDNTGVASAQADFTYQTAPDVGTVPVVGAASGTGNSGQVFMANNSDDAISPTWQYKGVMLASLQTIDVVTFRAAVTLVNMSQSTGTFMVVGRYI